MNVLSNTNFKGPLLLGLKKIRTVEAEPRFLPKSN